MKDNTEQRGTYTGYLEEPDTTYVTRFAEAIRNDSVLHGSPIPGDSVRVIVDSDRSAVHEGVFAGVGGRDRPGIYLNREYSPMWFLAESRIVAFERIDGSHISYSALQEAVFSGQVPPFRERTIRWIGVRTDKGLMEIDARDIDGITAVQKGKKGTALIVGLAMDLVVIGFAVLAGDDLIDLNLGSGAF
jgi:hypothetical protein